MADVMEDFPSVGTKGGRSLSWRSSGEGVGAAAWQGENHSNVRGTGWVKPTMFKLFSGQTPLFRWKLLMCNS